MPSSPSDSLRTSGTLSVASFTVSEKFGWFGISLAIASVSAGVKPSTRPMSLMAARDLSVPNVMIWPTQSRPYFWRTYSMTSPRLSSQKSTSMSGIDTRSGFRKRSKSRSNLSGQTSVMRSEYATSDAADDPRPGPTGIPFSRAARMKSATMSKYPA